MAWGDGREESCVVDLWVSEAGVMRCVVAVVVVVFPLPFPLFRKTCGVVMLTMRWQAGGNGVI